MNTLTNIIDELDRFVPEIHKHRIIEARATNAIHAVINVLDMIEDGFTEEETHDLTKKLILAIKSREISKFTNKIRAMDNANK